MEDRTCSIEDCDSPHSARGWCRVHYRRWSKWGDPTFKKRSGKGQALAFLEDAAMASTKDCIFYPHYRSRPKFRLNGRYVNAAKAVWILANGDPGNLHVLHSCDQGTEGCVNIRHLYLGDHARNMSDMAMLTRSEVDEIRARYATGGLTQLALAKEYGVSRSSIQRYVTGGGGAR